jgi:hypothetical protein
MSDRENEEMHPGGPRDDGADPGEYYDPLSESLDSTADGGDPLVDRRLRGLIGPIMPMNAPTSGFERVMLRVRRRRAKAAAFRAGGALLAAAAVVSCLFVGIHIGEGTTVPTAACGSGATGCAASHTAPPTGAGTASQPGSANPVATPTSPSTDVASSGSAPECATSDLAAAAAVVSASKAAGEEEFNIALTNLSTRVCSVYGYPGLKLEDMNKSQQATTVNRITDYPEQLVELTPGGTGAATTVRFDADVPGTGDATVGPCQPETYYVEITPPNQTTQLTTEINGGPVTVCDNGTLQVYPFVSGVVGPGQ